MLHLDDKADTPLYQQLYEQIRRDILSGSLPAGRRLRSLRGLAKDLQLSKNTVENAYSQLAVEGYIAALPGSGFIVTPLRQRLRPPETAAQFDAPSQTTDSESLETCAYDFHYGSLDASLFPYKIWRKLTADILANPPAGQANLSASRAVKGDIELRKELAGYLYNSKGVCCTPTQIIMCSGVRAAMDALLAVLDGEKLAAVEDPGYPGARAVFLNRGFALVPVLPDGLDLKSLEASAARIIYTTPSRQFPTGMPLPEEQRTRLLRWAEERDSLIIEDSYDSEFRYKGRTTPSLQSMDRHGRVVYLGTAHTQNMPNARKATQRPRGRRQ